MPGLRIREFSPDDASAVAALHARVFPGAWRCEEQFAAYIRELMFRNPWYDPELPSWIAEDADGMAGFFGVLPRRMVYGNLTLRVAVSCQFMVDPQKRRSLAAVELMRRYFAGPQDLSISDGANDATRSLWEAAGGTASALHNVHWVRLLRPAGGLVSLAGQVAPGLASIAAPLAALADACIPHFARSGMPWREEDLDAATLVSALQEHRGVFTLRPFYDKPSLEWLLEQARAKQRHGVLQGCVLRDEARRVTGWFLYYLSNSMSQVLQLGARRERLPEVLDRLFEHARARGAVAIQGRLEPHMAPALRGKRCLLVNRGISTLLHAKDPALLLPFYRGDAFFSRLDGEWWTRFSGGSPARAPRAYLRRIRAPRMYALRPWKSRAKEFALPS
jgi:hypothetical protein